MIEKTLTTALQHHQQGRFDEAARLYQAVLTEDPEHADALHLLGVLAHQHGSHSQAVELIERAIASDSRSATFYCNIAEAYRSLGRINEAIAAAQMALQLQGDYPEALINLGIALHDKGEFQQAERHLRDAIEVLPEFALAHTNLGNVLRQQGEVEEALTAYRRAVELDPQSARARSNLGQMLLQQLEVDEALVHCQEAIRLDPGFAEAHSNLGNVLRQQGELDRAKTHYETALRLNPNLAMVQNNLGQLHQEKGELEEAEQHYLLALRADPLSVRFHLNLASALTEHERFTEAISRYRLAQGIESDNALVHNGLAHALVQAGQLDEAIEVYQEAIEFNPELAIAHAGLGHAYEQAGRMDDADTCFRRALEHNPKAAGAYVGLATHHAKHLGGDDVDAMRGLLDEPYMADAQVAALHYGLAQILDKEGDYQAAADHLREANARRTADLAKRGERYDQSQHKMYVDQLVKTFDAAYVARVAGDSVAVGEPPSTSASRSPATVPAGLDTDVPVFIVGLPRSGTTLTEQILASHRQAFGAGELPLASQAINSIPGLLGLDQSPLAAIGQLIQTDLSGLLDISRGTAERHLEQLRALDSKALRIVDKMPDNYLHLGWISTMFPKARIIHCRRDERDTALSCWMTNFKSIRWANDIDQIVARVEQYRRVMGHWQRTLPMPMLEIDYRDTVCDLEGTARRIVDWVGLDWDESCIEFHRTERPIRTASVTQVRQPIYSRSLGRWKHYRTQLEELFDRISPSNDPTGTSPSYSSAAVQ